MSAGDSSSYRDVLAAPNLPVLLVATCLSRLAAEMFVLSIVLYGLDRFGSSTTAGILSAAAILPGLVISPLAGALLDRIGASRAITIDMLASAATIASIVVVDRAGWMSVPIAVTAVASFSLTSPLSAAGLRALLPRLVPEPMLDRVNALDTAIYSLVGVLGPALAGVAFSLFGANVVLVLIAAAYLLAATCVSALRVRRMASTSRGSLLRSAGEGLLLVVQQPTLRGLAISYSLYQISWGIFIIAVPVFAAQNFTGETGNLVAGILWAGVGAAGALGALLAGHLRTVGRERLVMAVGMAVVAFASWPLASEFGLAGLILALALAGMVAGPIDVGLLTLRQRRTDPDKLGRVLSVSISLNIAGFPLGCALAGVLITHSLSSAFLAAGLAAALGALTALLIPSE